MRGICHAQALAGAIMLIVAQACALAQDRTGKAESPACEPRQAITAKVKSIADGRTFLLEDGREVRLPAIEVQKSAQPALSKLIEGRELLLSPLVPPVDRYGRLNMRAFLNVDGKPQSVEARLVALGVALASPRGDDDVCLKDLLRSEQAARAGKLGQWSDDTRKKMRAEDPATLMVARGRFAAIDGKVISVRESGGTIYVNFGRRWNEDFTVTILKRNARKFAEAGMEPKQLEGRRVRVRGFIEERGGPWIEATVPQQIEVAD
jgi:endonuclease YncB( thermonuclease family)